MKNKKNNNTNKKEDGRKLPGEYPAREDAMINMERVDMDLDSLDTAQKSTARPGGDMLYPDNPQSPQRKESDLTREDFEALGPRDLSLDGGDDEQLKHRRRPVDFTGRGLDVPGSELDDDNEVLGSEDEENNSYSLGGDSKADLEDGGRP